jgi:hypothetical protein
MWTFRPPQAAFSDRVMFAAGGRPLVHDHVKFAGKCDVFIT